MTTFLLIRHGMNDAIGRRIVGRLPDIHLNAEGHGQVQRLAKRLAGVRLSAIYASPLERALETAAPIAEAQSLEPRVRNALTEVDFGEWSGLAFSALEGLAAWKRFNDYRTGTRPPGGELMIEVQQRMVGEVEFLRGLHPEGRVGIVSHGDPLKTVIAYYAGIPVELMHRIEISPASVSVLSLHAHGALIQQLNYTGELAST